jgi:hypothetical protein
VTVDTRYAALLIGNSVYPEDPHNLPELHGPVNDLALLREALTDPEMGLFRNEDVRVLPERSKREITTAMEAFLQRAVREEVVLFYYSGHGRRDDYDNLYLCARDTRTDLLMSTAISDNEINGMMRSCAAMTFVVMLDCCYSGAFKGAGLPAHLRGAGRFLITSSRHGQLSADADEPGGASAFTRHLVAALKSGALDANHDGYVSLNDVYDYVLARLQEDTRQIPERHFDHAVGDVAMARGRSSPKPASAPAATPRPELAVSETDIEIRNVQPGEQLPPEIVDVFNRGTGELDWVAESDAGWIQVDPHPSYVVLTMRPAPGSNRGRVRVRDRGGGGGSRTIRVHVEVLREEQQPRLRLSSTELDFGALRLHVDSPSRSVQLINLGSGQLDATATATHPQIVLHQRGDTIEVTIDTRTAGDVRGEVEVGSAGGSGRIRVTARVRSGPVLDVGVAAIDFGTVPAGQHPVRLVPVRNVGAGELTWDFGNTTDFGTVERVPEGLAVRLTRRAVGQVRGEVWVLSDGGDALVEVRADVIAAVAGRRRTLAVVGAVAALGLAGGAIAYGAVLRTHADGSGPGNGGVVGPGRPSATPAPSHVSVRVPPVYNLSEAAGAQQLRAAGFAVRSIHVCSGSVQQGNVRQVLTDIGDPDGQVVDDQGGVTEAGTSLARGTGLVMKISTGIPCNGGTPVPAQTTYPSPPRSPTRTPVTTPPSPTGPSLPSPTGPSLLSPTH